MSVMTPSPAVYKLSVRTVVRLCSVGGVGCGGRWRLGGWGGVKSVFVVSLDYLC